MTDGVGTTTWTYDALNRPAEITDPFDTLVRYGYDPNGNRGYVSDPIKTAYYEYDEVNRLKKVDDLTKNTYDDAGRLTGLQHATEESLLASYQYTYDNVGNRTQAFERFQTAGAGPTIRLTVVDDVGWLQPGKEVHGYGGETYTGYHQTTDANGQVAITLPQGSYRFRVDVDEVHFWTGEENHCTIGERRSLLLTIPIPVGLGVWDGGTML